VRDYGRGLQIEHFTLNENEEKLASEAGIIGKFGVGLKDALATFHRRGVLMTIRSRYGLFRLQEAHKHNFDGITTLHVEYEPGDFGVGTDVELRGVSAADVDIAKLRFSDDALIETTSYGQILRGRDGPARVYITLVFANEEPNFLFSYNITSLTPAMKKRLNRERLNVGRTTYAERVKAILRSAQSEEVCEALADQVRARSRGDQCDEMQWVEIAHRALNILHEQSRVAFVSESEVEVAPDMIDHMRRDGYEVVLVSDTHKAKLDEQYEAGDKDLRTMEGYVTEFNESFSYQFVDPEDLTGEERLIFEQTPGILKLVGVRVAAAPRIRISETTRLGLDSTEGVWDRAEQAIIIKRSTLDSLAHYAGTLLHELAHATTGAPDVTRQFETALTEYLGQTARRAVDAA
jgi:hypothetical protein